MSENGEITIFAEPTEPVIDEQSTRDSRHDDRVMLYCRTCRTTASALSIIEQHIDHDYVKATEVRATLENEASEIAFKINYCNSLFQKIEEDMQKFEIDVSTTEAEVEQKADELQKIIEQQKKTLLDQVKTLEETQRAQYELVRTNITKKVSEMKDKKQEISKTIKKSSFSEMADYLVSNQENVKELKALDSIEGALTDLALGKISFTASKPTGNFIGSVTSHVKDSSESGRLKHILRKGQPVGGITALEDSIYVVRNRNNERIEVYDVETFAPQKPLYVPGLSDLPWSLASCPKSYCLYVCDDYNYLYRVDLPKTRTTAPPAKTKWSVASTPTGLSVNSQGNVVVACYGANRIQVYTPGGNLFRDISLRNEILNPLHAVQLDREMYLVCHGQWGLGYMVSVVSFDGKCVGGLHYANTMKKQRLSGSSCAAVIKGGLTVVYEWDRPTSRVLLLNRSLDGSRDLLVTVDGGLDQPWAIFVDQVRGRIYIGEQRGGRVLVFDNMFSQLSSSSSSSC